MDRPRVEHINMSYLLVVRLYKPMQTITTHTITMSHDGQISSGGTVV